MKWVADAEDSGLTLVAFLRKKCGDEYSARKLKAALEHNLCRVNGVPQRFASFILAKNDEILFDFSAFRNLHGKQLPHWDLLFVDDDLLVINKPPKISSESPLLRKALQDLYGCVSLVHRLDKDTTGVLVFSRNDEAHAFLLKEFRERKVVKKYWALCDGIPKTKQGMIENTLGKQKQFQGQAIWGSVKKEGQYAKSEWCLRAKGKGASLLECYPLTGRTHQIRVHLKEMGYPILGDFHYCRHFRCLYKAKRPLLHAFSLTLRHPRTNLQETFIAPIPKDFKMALDSLLGGINL